MKLAEAAPVTVTVSVIVKYPFLETMGVVGWAVVGAEVVEAPKTGELLTVTIPHDDCGAGWTHTLTSKNAGAPVTSQGANDWAPMGQLVTPASRIM